MKRLLALTLLACLFVGCCPLEVGPAKKLSQAVRNEYLAYVQADERLDADQKQLRVDTWDAFDLWVRTVEGTNK